MAVILMTGDTPIPTPEPNRPLDLSATPSPEAIRVITSQQLMQGQRELLIEHSGETYRLRITRNGKLILNK